MREDKLGNIEKYETLCSLALGVAHDLNNVLMVISGNIELAKTLVEDKAVHVVLHEAVKACKKALDTAGRLSRYAAGSLSPENPPVSASSMLPAPTSWLTCCEPGSEITRRSARLRTALLLYHRDGSIAS